MKVNIEIRLKPFRVPNFVLADKDSADPSNDTKFALADLDANTLEALCEDFTREIFRKAGKERPERDQQA